MEGGEKDPDSLSMRTDNSREQPPDFSKEERPQPNAETDEADSGCLKSERSMTPPLYFGSKNKDDWTGMPDAAQSTAGGQLTKRLHDLALPQPMETWTEEEVKDWLVIGLRVPQHIAQTLCDQGCSGACLVSFDKQDLLDLGVPPAPAILITKKVEMYKRQSEMFVSKADPMSTKLGEIERKRRAEIIEESLENESVLSDSGIQSQSSVIYQESTDDKQFISDVTEALALQPPSGPMCHLRPFDKSSSSTFYVSGGILPLMTGPTNLLDPIHEYQLLPEASETSEKEILYEFTKEVFTFAASCMNSRTNGTIHFGVQNQSEQGHGQVVGQKVTSSSKYIEAFESDLSKYFGEKHVDTARMCIRPPNFIQVCRQDGTAADEWVIEVDVVPMQSLIQDEIFYTLMSIVSTEEKQQRQTECLFVRDGQRSRNILADTDPRRVQEEMKSLLEKVKCWVLARSAAEGKDEKHPTPGNQGQRLKQLITRGKEAFETSVQVILVTDKCPPSQLEHLDFLNEITLFAVLEFDPQSDVNGTCSSYRKDHIGNLHYPRMYNTQDSVTSTVQKLNLFKQTSWVFCNGRENEDSETDRPLAPSEWLKKRSGEVNNLVSFLLKPDFLSRDRLLVIILLHSAVTDISSPILEVFCAIHRTLEGSDNILCICKDITAFHHWRQLIESRCKEDITSKCIYELSLNEISSTIKKLKEPQTQSSRRFLPSTGSSSVLLTKKDEELMTVLDILCENECENTEIETKDSFQEFKIKTEEDFYRGGQVTWWNFYLSERDNLPFISRDKYSELHELITPAEGHRTPCVIINLFHHPGCGGTTLAMHVLWNLRGKLRCAVVKNNMATNQEIAAQVMTLLKYGKQDQSSYKPVLLLVDNWDDMADLKLCMLTAASDRRNPNQIQVIILNCARTMFPDESSRNSHTANISITNKLSPREQSLFSEKLQQLKSYHEKPDTFYAFMIMANNFSETYITNVVTNIIGDLDVTTQQGRLLSFLALLNTYVNGSYMSLSICEELVGIRSGLGITKAFFKQETLNEKMNPYSTLMITYTVEEHGTYQAVRLLHQRIASKCLEVLSQRHSLSQSEITVNLLHCDRLYKSCMGKDFLVQNIQSMLITRQKKEHGDDKDTYFSPLIENIEEKEGPDKVRDILQKAIERFDKSATLPQALARYFCLRDKQFELALKWALDAERKNSNSYIADTVGQVYKSQFKKEIENPQDLTPETLDQSLKLASCAVTAFRNSQELAKRDNVSDTLDIYNKKRHKSYNTSGYAGETDVIMDLLGHMLSLPVLVSGEKYRKDQVLQFLKGRHPVSSLHDSRNPNSNQFVAVLGQHEKFLISLMPRLKEVFNFFESYFTYLKPRSPQKEIADEKNKKKISDHFKKYIEIFNVSEADKASEKSSKPNLSLSQEIVDHRSYLESVRADSFAGLLQHLNDKNANEMEKILKKWQFIFEKSSVRYVSDTVNLILANIVLHSLRPYSKLLKKYEELVSLLNEVLQKEGTHSNVTEMYYLSMLLLWPSKEEKLESSAASRNIMTYITSAKKSFHRRFSHMFPVRSAIAHFFLGKSKDLKKVVSKVKLDQILMEVSKQQASSNGQGRQSPKVHYMWQSGEAWNEPEIQKKLLRIRGQSEQGRIYVHYGGNCNIEVRPVYLGDIRSGYSREEVSFYLGFTMDGPVAYNITYKNEQ